MVACNGGLQLIAAIGQNAKRRTCCLRGRHTVGTGHRRVGPYGPGPLASGDGAGLTSPAQPGAIASGAIKVTRLTLWRFKNRPVLRFAEAATNRHPPAARRRSLIDMLALMGGSSFGQALRVVTFGESHGPAVGAVIDGCPPRLILDVEDVQRDLDRRRPGQSRLTTQRQEQDRAEILSGIFEGRTLGTPIAIVVRNDDARPGAYEAMKDLYRPSHADFTTEAKYGLRDWRGGGRASARETVGRVAAGAVARVLLRSVAGVEVLAWVRQVADIEVEVSPHDVDLDAVEANDVRCPDRVTASAMVARIEAARRDGDSVGGVVECVAPQLRAASGTSATQLRQLVVAEHEELARHVSSSKVAEWT